MAHEDPAPLADEGPSRVTETIQAAWESSLQATRDAMEMLRTIWPELTQTLPEPGARSIGQALSSLEAASGDLHRAGRHVLGEDSYEDYLEQRLRTQDAD